MHSIDNKIRRTRRLLAVSIVAMLSTLAATQGWGQERATALEILELTPEMKLFVNSRVSERDDPKGVLNSLIDAVFGPSGLAIEYGNSRTKTPAETFQTHSGNCLSFTMLFVAMARHVGLEARFNEVTEILAWDRRGAFVVNNRHMFAEVEIENARVRVDFLPGERKRYRLVQRISDERALAHYYNNLGAEAVAAGSDESALAYFAESLRMDESLSLAWVNQGVAYRRSGEFDRAEASYRRALELDPSETTAASNLAALYNAIGRERQAERYLKIAKNHQQRNPFYHYRLGLQTAAGGELEEAVRHLKKAIRRDFEDPTFHAELAAVYTRLGDSRKANQSLVKAMELSADDNEREAIQRRLEKVVAEVSSLPVLSR